MMCFLTKKKEKKKKIDDLHISHKASGMEANVRVFLIRNIVVTAH